MLADYYEFEGLLISLKVRGLMDSGDYIVVGVDPKQYDPSDPAKYIEGMGNPFLFQSNMHRMSSVQVLFAKRLLLRSVPLSKGSFRWCQQLLFTPGLRTSPKLSIIIWSDLHSTSTTHLIKKDRE